MSWPDRFLEQVEDAYAHLYDLVYLRTHPLTALLISDPSLDRKERAWQLHSLLLESIEELDPGPQAPVDSWEWRRYHLLHYRYREGWTPQAVAKRLGISLRHVYREEKRAFKAIAEVLWHQVQANLPGEAPTEEPGAIPLQRLELLRLEAERLSRKGQQTSLRDVIEGLVPLLQRLARQRGMQMSVHIPEYLPHLAAHAEILRQILLGLFGYLTTGREGGHIWLQAVKLGNEVSIRLIFQQGAEGQNVNLLNTPLLSSEEELIKLTVLEELATLHGLSLQRLSEREDSIGFELLLPATQPRTILIVDDNEDTLHLFCRYLAGAGYRVITARSGAEALRLAEELQPYAITLDLMMTDQDGWEVLQSLTYHPRLKEIPILVCTVLAERDLALALGAAGFLSKPVSQSDLLTALQALEQDRSHSSVLPSR